MVGNNIKSQYRYLFNNYPLVDMKPLDNLKLERAKTVLVARAIHNTTGLDEQEILSRMCKIRGICLDALPSLIEACRVTGVRLDFINDYNKLQYLYERSVAMQQLPMLLTTL